MEIPTACVVALVADAIAFAAARVLNPRQPELAFGAVSMIVLFAAATLVAGVGLSNALGWTWAIYPGLVLSALVCALMVLKTHRSLLRAISGGRLAKVRRFSSVADIETRHHARVGPRLRAFIEGQWERVDGRIAAELPTYQSDPDTGIAMSFGDIDILSVAEDWEIDWSAHAGWIPLARLVCRSGDAEPQFLLVQGSPPHAVGMWEHETGKIERVTDSLDALLDAAKAPPVGLRSTGDH